MTGKDPLFDVTGKICIVTGGLGQLGAQYVKALHERDARVAVWAIAKMIRKKARKVKIKPIGSVQDKTTNRIPKTRIIIGKAILTKALFLVTFGL